LRSAILFFSPMVDDSERPTSSARPPYPIFNPGR
jgi:hypothetical protein